MKLATLLIAFASLTHGSGFATGTIKPNTMSRLSLPLKGNEATTIIVKGNGGDLDCYLYAGREDGAPFGKFVARDTSSRDGCSLAVRPSKDETYTLLVQNSSDHDERYTLTVK